MKTLSQDTKTTYLYTALITPFDADGKVDFAVLESLVKEQQGAGNGILLCGSTAEGLALEPSEQLSIVEFVVALNVSVPIMVAVGGYHLDQQLTWIKHCNELNVDAFLLTAPLYAKPGPVGQTMWFKALLDATDKPCMLYNVPSRSGVQIYCETVSNLAEHKNLWAMKEASGDIHQFIALRDAAPKMKMYSGEDGLMPYLASAGAVGLVSVCSNPWPQASNLYVQKSLQGTRPEALNVWYSAVNSLFEVANPIPVKVLMHKLGLISTPLLRAPLTHLELDSDQALIAADKAIKAWLKQHDVTLKAVN
ncbi:4-hydroxy-tetrahydrodipicolinate synthase [Thalassotalea aquiviva]|uniref:4-hydroxy-tetrahydrodipicolinate synthase n=1 Tax=Thalassotalea aquiviva TaxID=3242415 RepID=UPI00352B9292